MCGDSKDEKQQQPPPPVVEPAAEESSDGEDLDVVVGVAVPTEDGDEYFMRKIKLHVHPRTKVKHIVKIVNKVISKAELAFDVENLVPVWTPNWDKLPSNGKFLKTLKHSQDAEGHDFDARHQDVIHLLGIDAHDFDEDFWKDHLDFDAAEWEWFDADEFEDSYSE